MHHLQAALLLITLTFVTSCQNLPWEQKERLPGERVPLLQADLLAPSATQVRISVGKICRNDTWPAPVSCDNLELATQASGDSHKPLRGSGSKAKVYTPLAAADDTVFWLDAAGTLRAIDLESGAVKWQNNDFTTGARQLASQSTCVGGVAFDRGIVHASCGTNEVIAVDAKSGQTLWKKNVGHQVRATPALSAQYVIAQTVDGIVYALKRSDGSVAWIHWCGTVPSYTTLTTAAPIVNGQKVWVQFEPGYIQVLDLKTGELAWQYDLADDYTKNHLLRTVPYVQYKMHSSGGTLYLYDANQIAAFDMRRGAGMGTNDEVAIPLLWNAKLQVAGQVWRSGNSIYATALSLGRTALVALDAGSGGVIWSTDISKYEDKGSWLPPVVANGRVLLVHSAGVLYSFSAEDGAMVASQQVPRTYTPIAIVKGEMMLVDVNGNLHRLMS